MEIKTLQEAYNAACDEVETCSKAWDELAADASDEDVDAAKDALSNAADAADKAKSRMEQYESAQKAREKFTKVELAADEKPALGIEVNEPDLYTAGENRFLQDLYLAQLRGDRVAADRIAKHQAFEVEKYAVATATLGGIIPPQYLVDMYAKASRNGRVFLDQVNGSDPLPDEGMSLIVPRLTTGVAAGIQASESATVTTQDPVESDLTVPVRTISGYVPVSRQTLERAAYSERILFEDLLARYWSKLDSQALSGSGSSGQHLGLFNTSGIVSKYAGDNTIATLWKKVADCIQTIESKWGGLGIRPDKIVMHPRRWGYISSLLDSNSRPLFGYNNAPTFNANAVGVVNDYGFMGYFQGLPVYTDSNVPTNFGTNSDEDGLAVIASSVVHLWERDNDPVTLSFEQQAGTALQVQLVAYGYSAFTAGRYPDASAILEGLLAPTF